MQLKPGNWLEGRLEELLEEVRETVLAQGEGLDLVISVLETAQRTLPRISLAELARMESGQEPVSKTAYLLGRLEGAIVDLEDVVGNLREDLERGLQASSLKLERAEFRDIEGAIRRVAG